MTPIKPVLDSTVTLAATTTSADVALTGLPASGRVQLRLHNAGPDLAFVTFGADNVPAKVATSIPLPADIVEVITVDVADVTHMAAITSSGTATVYATPGDGA